MGGRKGGTGTEKGGENIALVVGGDKRPLWAG